MAFALFNFFSRNEIEVGRVSWITSEFDQEKMTNDRWDMAQVLQVGWPKNGALIQLSPGSARYPAKIISISGKTWFFLHQTLIIYGNPGQ
ncbi:hypothetical protein HOLleu_02276 [Holothuria leucospilota]|uniref:Uncharacterized protein n=1 Tax=Holothuria leucospilota TaxID=206669 RepID=A0A9Q1CS61_HOLLE|nr:hypothetical protein HOLleu_02276 [Holothuria leucospilota]